MSMKIHPRVRMRRLWRGVLRLGLLGFLALVVLGLVYCYRAQQYDLGDLQKLPQRVEVLDRHGERIGMLSGQRRFVVPFSRINDKFYQAVLAREDSRFEGHQGVDWLGFARSMLRNIQERKLVQGGSTLSMQLARNTWELGGDDLLGEIDRKLMEMALAYRMEVSLSKEEIFEAYANCIYFGEQNFGVEAAARDYFGKSAASLNWAEACSLAGLIRGPSVLNPRDDRLANLAECRQVLERMVAEGWMEAQEALRVRENLAAHLQVKKPQGAEPTRSLWLMEYIERELKAKLSPEELANVAQVRTSFDLDWQLRAERQVEAHLQRIEAAQAFQNLHKLEINGGKMSALQAAVAVVNERGELVVLVGGRDFALSPFQRAVDMRRQLGSTVKPFVYAAALAKGLNAQALISDAPLREEELGEKGWAPRNADGRNLGNLPAMEGLILSRNTMSVRVARHAGVKKVAEQFAAVGLDEQPEGESAWLGAGQGSPLQMAAAFASVGLGNAGEFIEPHALLEVRDERARVLWSAETKSRQAMDAQVARQIHEALHQATLRGTAKSLAGISQASPGRHLAGKTGTTSGFHDAWFVGYDREYCASVWVGFDQPQKIVDGGYGSVLALPLWRKLMLD